MKRFFFGKRHLKYQLRLFLLFSVLAVCILMGCIVLFYNYNAHLIRKDWEKSCIQTTTALGNITDNLFQNMDDTAKEIHSSERIMQYMKLLYDRNSEADYFSENPQALSEVQSILYMASAGKNLEGRLAVTSVNYDRAGLYSELGEIEYSKEKMKELDVLQEGMSLTPYTSVYGPYEDPWNIKHEQTITILRPFRDTYRIYGLVEYSITLEHFQKLLKQNGFGEEKIVIYNEDGKKIYSSFSAEDIPKTDAAFAAEDIPRTDAAFAAEDIPRTDAAEQDEELPEVDYVNHYLTTRWNSEISGWRIVVFKDVEDMNYAKQLLAGILLLTIVSGIVLVLFISYIISNRLSKPIREMKGTLDSLAVDETVALNIPTQNNEILSLSHAIENMIERIKNQNEAVLIARERELEAYMHSLEAQLDAHFLYNTLAVIGVCGKEDGSENVSRMCSELALLLRYSVNYSEGEVTLKEELENIRSYLYIMKMRYDDFVEITWDLDEAVENVRVPKLILQPIVENCFKHGFINSDPVWKIHIKSYRKVDNWMVCIENNGFPITREETKRLLEHCGKIKENARSAEESPSYEKEGFGLTNTVIRMYFYYDGREHFEIGSRDGNTYVEIGGPVI
jgi:two-component system sensor histidine kinase YesM